MECHSLEAVVLPSKALIPSLQCCGNDSAAAEHSAFTDLAKSVLFSVYFSSPSSAFGLLLWRDIDSFTWLPWGNLSTNATAHSLSRQGLSCIHFVPWAEGWRGINDISSEEVHLTFRTYDFVKGGFVKSGWALLQTYEAWTSFNGCIKKNNKKGTPFLIPWRNSSSLSRHPHHCLNVLDVLEATNPLFTS